MILSKTSMQRELNTLEMDISDYAAFIAHERFAMLVALDKVQLYAQYDSMKQTRFLLKSRLDRLHPN
jgi:phage-related protein